MNRREFLCAAGAAGSLGAIGGDLPGSPSPVIRIWLSREAAAHDGLPALAAGYVRRAVGAARDDVTVDVADRPIALDEEDGEELMRVTWPKMVLEGAVGRGPVQPTGDVNLLVTNGSPWSRPAGYGMRGIAAATGASWLAEMPPPERGPTTTEQTTTGTVAQLLLHECGHALGLEHDHGTVVRDGNDVTASPMIGGYAWEEAEEGAGEERREATEAAAADPPSLRRRLGLEYSDRAIAALRDYRGGPLL